MFEHLTYEELLARMLARAKEIDKTLDTREGSLIWYALAPAAAEISEMYRMMDQFIDEAFADTATREYLIRRCAERGIIPSEQTHAILKGEFNREIPIGARFSLDMLNYTAVQQISSGVYQMQCETAGEAGNSYFGTLLPIEYIEGLERAELTELLIPGEEEESTEALRQRYFSSMESQAFGGNIADYKEKAAAIAGVGGVKVTPVWQGGGTVKLTIIGSDFGIPSDLLLAQVQEAIDPAESSGQGAGIAPIGHMVTVTGVRGTQIDIEAQITYEEGWEWAGLAGYAKAAADAYFKELGQEWALQEALTVRVSQIETRLLALGGVVDITGTRLNGEENNITLDSDSIPVRGEMLG